MSKFGFLLTAGLLALIVYAPGAEAQTVNSKAKERVRWYSAPREIQIIDDRPVVRDFREAPQRPQQIQLPPGPGAAPGFSGGGAGALGDDGGTLPSGGMNIPGGGGDPGYRTDGPMSPMGGLPKADFAHQPTNIPARGMGPKGPLPGGFTTGVHAKLQPWAKPMPTAASSAGPRAGNRPAAAAAPAPVAASYGGGYGPSTGYSGGGSSTSTNVHGKLLNRIK